MLPVQSVYRLCVSCPVVCVPCPMSVSAGECISCWYPSVLCIVSCIISFRCYVCCMSSCVCLYLVVCSHIHASVPSHVYTHTPKNKQKEFGRQQLITNDEFCSFSVNFPLKWSFCSICVWSPWNSMIWANTASDAIIGAKTKWFPYFTWEICFLYIENKKLRKSPGGTLAMAKHLLLILKIPIENRLIYPKQEKWSKIGAISITCIMPLGQWIILLKPIINAKKLRICLICLYHL